MYVRTVFCTKYLLFYSLFPMFNHFLCVFPRVYVRMIRKSTKKTGGIFSCNKNVCVLCVTYILCVTERVFFFSIRICLHYKLIVYVRTTESNGVAMLGGCFCGWIFRWVANHTESYNYVYSKNRWENSNNIIIRSCVYTYRAYLVFFFLLINIRTLHIEIQKNNV